MYVCIICTCVHTYIYIIYMYVQLYVCKYVSHLSYWLYWEETIETIKFRVSLKVM